ncbi:DUF4335 domain-containing protein [Oscillatoria sp. CS-180]|uniref:DUF4335 domain-containing protein n=1 Tax=Oscillatoria sp. CS-180 TaxID=3021720 RepID=UPI00232A811B|nr:DUF4335 domain-containing protein [Oscillatoria sp. CS-180]MDB9528140.1 DUF4335 domain-containing protein [Oscillatoria sp. CS-180]
MTSTTQLIPLHYETPTVTLDVMAREAAISQWSDKPVVQVLRYQLQVRNLDETNEGVEIQGDRDSFLPLVEAVQIYIQSQLTGIDDSNRSLSNLPYVESNSLTQCTLHLGQLRTTTGATTLSLGAIQLSDLGNVLNQLETQFRPLPVAIAPQRQRPLWRSWGTTAAGMVAAVGITTAIWSTYRSPQTSLDTASETAVIEAAPQTINRAEEQRPRSQPLDDRADSPEIASEAVESDEIENRSIAEPSEEASEPVERSDAPTTDNAPKNRPSPTQSPADNEERRTNKPAPQDTSSPAADADRPMEAELEQETVPEPEAPETPTIAQTAPSQLPPAPSPEIATEGDESLAEDETLAEDAAETGDEQFLARPEGLDEQESEQPSPPTDTQSSLSIASEEMPSSGSSARVDASPAVFSLDILIEQIRDRWPHPDFPDETLTYMLTIAADGTLIDVQPADDLSAQYRDRTGIPEPGTAVFSTDTPQTLQILLLPNGNIEIADPSI